MWSPTVRNQAELEKELASMALQRVNHYGLRMPVNEQYPVWIKQEQIRLTGKPALSNADIVLG